MVMLQESASLWSGWGLLYIDIPNARPTGSACVPCYMTDETCVTASFVVQFRFADERIGIDLSYGIR